MSACTTPSARRAVAYARRSTDRQEQSLDDQRRAIETYAEREGVEIVAWYSDDAISGASVDARAGFKKMLADAAAPDRAWRQVLVYDVSRFSRGDLDEAGHLRYRFREVGVDVVYVAENLTGGEADDLVVGVKQWMAQKYVKDLSKVTLRGQLSHTESGAWNGGTPPYGYDLLYSDSNGRPYQRVRWTETGDKEVFTRDGQLLRVVPRGQRLSVSKQDRACLIPSSQERIEVIRRIFRAYTEHGHGFRTIVEHLNREGIVSPRDGNWSENTHAAWSAGTIRAILKNPAYRGDLVWNRRTFAKFHRVRGGAPAERPRVEADKPRENAQADWIVVAGAHEGLVTASTFDRAQELMGARRNATSERNFRRGSGLRSPYLLSGLIQCGRCGRAYQGRVVGSSKHRKDGTRIKSFYYCCGGHVMQGNAVCKKFLVVKDALEELLLDAVRARLAALLAGEGESLLRGYVQEEIERQGVDPRRELAQVRARLAEIAAKADVLLESLVPENRDFVNAKLQTLAAEKARLLRRVEELEAAAPYQAIDADAVVRDGLARLQDLPRLLDSASLEERKEFVHAFIARVTIHPDEKEVTLEMKELPVASVPQPGVSSVELVAGARFPTLQVNVTLPPRALTPPRRLTRCAA